MSQPTLFMWPANNDAGRDLLDAHVRPLATRLNVRLELPPSGADRRHMSRGLRNSNAAILDCSVEEGHIYHKYNEMPKVMNHALLCSRTPLPRNVYAFHQHAPVHGQSLTNGQLAQWLEIILPTVLALPMAKGLSGYFSEMQANLQRQDGFLAEHTGMVVSYRGTHAKAVAALAAQLQQHVKYPLRIVPKGEFAYETECLSRQRMWEVVARLANEVRVAEAVLLYLSDDYFDSFWTCSELLAIQFYRMHPDKAIRDGYTADPLTGALHRLTFEAEGLPVPILTPQQRERFNHLRKNHDPGSVAPEGRRSRAGLFDQVVGWVVRRIGFYDLEFSSSSWWRDVLVPCPNCRPHRRSAIDVNWNQHLAIEAYGYFACSSDQLRVDEPMCCPRCRQPFFMTHAKPPRTLWIPGPTGRPWPQDMAVIEYEPVWEVLTERQRNNPRYPQGFKANS